jgi:hypothetical protein
VASVYCGPPFVCEKSSATCKVCGHSGQPCCEGDVCFGDGGTCNPSTDTCN